MYMVGEHPKIGQKWDDKKHVDMWMTNPGSPNLLIPSLLSQM